MAVPAWLKNKASVLRFSLIPGSLVFYFATADFLGFLIAASMLLIVLFLAFGVRWPIAVMVAFVGTFVIHFAFYSVLMVPLPWGVLETIAW
jgi:putative tricarboxylic transport membrane protein